MKRKGFTLIELLIVVAIIAILAAIAVPNFLEAQIRSKASRVKTELRTFATAIESYYTDWNVPPPEAGEVTGVGVFAPLTIEGRTGQTGILTPSITTPVAYISKFDIYDPFLATDALQRPDIRLYSYHCYKWKWWEQPDTYALTHSDVLTGYEFKDYYEAWRLFSIGPDKQYDNIPGGSQFTIPSPVGLPYDPTNGTVSTGNIIRSQKFSEQRTWKEI